MSETIKDVDIVKQHELDLTAYSIYVARKRVVPDERDGLKPVHRRILYTMYNDEKAYSGARGYVKTATIVGSVIGRYHPHGDAAVAEAIKPMVNWFEIKNPLVDGKGGWGDPLGFRMSNQRYTESKLTEYSLDCIISELKEAYNSVDWELNFSDTLKEPKFLPAAVPNLLINGAYGISSGLAVDIPRHNFGEVIDATIKLIHNPKASVVLVPDNCMDTDIIDSDWKKICNTGRGTYKVRARVEIAEYMGKPALHVTSVPDLVFFDKIKEGIEKLMDPKVNKLPQIVDIVDLSGDDDDTEITDMNIYIVLKKDTDANYVRDFLFSTTMLEKTRGVNFEILIDDRPVCISYKQYLLDFIEFRKMTKFRMYCNRMKEAKTTYHKMALYIKAMESGEIDNILKMIRTQKGTDDTEYVEYLVKKLKVTDVQAKYLLSIDVRKLSIGYLKKYKAIMEKAIKDAGHFFDMINCEGLINKEIEDELKYYKKKYNKPRMSKLISAEEASNIPEGIFRVVITKNNFIKKMDSLDDKIGSLGGAQPLCVFDANNRDNVLIFGKLGKVFKLPISKIPFGSKGNPGIDIRKLIKNLTSDICTVIVESNLKKFAENKKNFIYVLSRNGYIKRLSCEDFMNVSLAGTIFSKVEDDLVVDVLFMSEKFQFVVYSRNKVLRLSGTEAPYLRRATKGVYSMKTQYPMDGMDCVYPAATDLVVVTSHGYVNKIPLTALPLSKRMKVGNSVIKLGKTDNIVKIAVCKESDVINLYSNGDITPITVSDLALGSSIGTGHKIIANVIKADVVR